MKTLIYKGMEFPCCGDKYCDTSDYHMQNYHYGIKNGVDYMVANGLSLLGFVEPSNGKPPVSTPSEYVQKSTEPVLECKWFHGVRSDSIKSYAQYGILPREKLKEIGFDAYHDSKPRTVYVTSKFKTAVGFANANHDHLIGYPTHLGYTIILCMGAIQVVRKDRNGDEKAVEVHKRIRPEYLRVHNYQGIIGLCWPLLWVAKENGWSFDVS